jgi:hypothetical protein
VERLWSGCGHNTKLLERFLRTEEDLECLWLTCQPSCWVEVPALVRLRVLLVRQHSESVGDMVVFLYIPCRAFDVNRGLMGPYRLGSPRFSCAASDFDDDATQSVPIALRLL